MSYDRLRARIIKHEGLRLKPYRDTVGKLTLGVGRNLDDVGITRGEALHMLDNDIARCMADLDAQLSWWRSLDEARHGVLIEMCFNLGIRGLLGFKNTLRAVQEGRYEDAAHGMMHSKWATQVKGRAVTLARIMRTGADIETF